MAKKRRIKGRFYVILLLFFVAAGLLIYFLLSRRDAGVLTSGSIHMELDEDTVLIRDEEIVTVEKYDRVTFLVGEDSQVEVGTAIAEVYKWGYTDDMTNSLISVQQEVLKSQLALLEGVEKPELSALLLQIQKKEEAIREAVMHGSGDLLTLEQELCALIQQRTTYLKDNVQPTAELTDLYEEEELRKTQLLAWKSEIAAKQGGVVSFYFDGYEKVFCADKLEMVNADLITSALKKSGDTAITTEGRLYRLVNDTDWYVAFVTSADDMQRVVAGESYSVVFDGYTESPYLGMALSPVVEGSSVVNILHFTQPIGDLLSVRTLKATLKLDAEGVLIPKEAVTVKDGVVTVELENGEGSSTVEVAVVATDGDNAVIRPVNPGDTVAAGMRYVKP